MQAFYEDFKNPNLGLPALYVAKYLLLRIDRKFKIKLSPEGQNFEF